MPVDSYNKLINLLTEEFKNTTYPHLKDLVVYCVDQENFNNNRVPAQILYKLRRFLQITRNIRDTEEPNGAGTKNLDLNVALLCVFCEYAYKALYKGSIKPGHAFKSFFQCLPDQARIEGLIGHVSGNRTHTKTLDILYGLRCAIFHEAKIDEYCFMEGISGNVSSFDSNHYTFTKYELFEAVVIDSTLYLLDFYIRDPEGFQKYCYLNNYVIKLD